MALQTKIKKPAQNMYVIPAHRQKGETLPLLPHGAPVESDASFHHVITHMSEDWTSSFSEEDLTLSREVTFKKTSVVKETHTFVKNHSENLIITKENCHPDSENLIIKKEHCHGDRIVVLNNKQQEKNEVVAVKERVDTSSDRKVQMKQKGKEEPLRITSTKNSNIMSDLDIYQMTRSLVLKEKYLVKENNSCSETHLHLSKMSPNAAEFKYRDFQEKKDSRIVNLAEKESISAASEISETRAKMCIDKHSEMDRSPSREITLASSGLSNTSSMKTSAKDSELNRTHSKDLKSEGSEWIRTISFKGADKTGSEVSRTLTEQLTCGGSEHEQVLPNKVEGSKLNRTPNKELKSEGPEWIRTISFKSTKVSEPSRTSGKETSPETSEFIHPDSDAVGSESPSKEIMCSGYNNQDSLQLIDTKNKSSLSLSCHAFSKELSCSDIKKNLLKDLSNVGSETRQRNISQDSGISVSSYDVSNTRQRNISQDSGISVSSYDVSNTRQRNISQDSGISVSSYDVSNTEKNTAMDSSYLSFISNRQNSSTKHRLLLNGVENLSISTRQKYSKKLKKMITFRDLLTRAVKGQMMTDKEYVQLFKCIMVRIWNKGSYRQLAKICALMIKKQHAEVEQDGENQSGPTFPKILLECCEDLINDFPSVKKQHYCHWRDFLSFLKVLYQDVQDLSQDFPKYISQMLIKIGYLTS